MQDTVTKCIGLVTQFNPLSVAPGALVRANNAVCIRENNFENRRGFNVDGTLASTPVQQMTYLGHVLVHNGSTISYRNLSTSTGTYANYSGSYSAISGYKMRFGTGISNLYVTTTLGVKVFSDVAGTAARSAGCPRSLDPSYALNAAISGFLPTGSQCAYRALIQRTDANSNVFFGYPSSRLWVTNASGNAKNIDLTLYLPAECIAGDVIQFYRTNQQVGTTTDLSGDEMLLCYQYTLLSADISAGFITFTDSLVDALLGAYLYTNPNSGQGITQANDRPPLCKDLCLYRSQFMFYANSQTKMRLNFALLATGGLSGNTITLAGTTYAFGAENTATGTVGISATGVIATDIDLTARSFVRVINRYATNTSVYAYYLSGPTDVPGKIMIEERGIGAAAFTITASNAAIQVDFSPRPPTSGTTAASTSSNDVAKNRLYFSKSNELEHVPALNYVPVGPSSEEILRIVPLRDSLIIICTSGVYRLTGETISNFVISPLDLTVRCTSADSVVLLNNNVLMLSNQGVVAISDSGVQVVSEEIEDELKPLLTYPTISSNTSAVAYESDKNYILSTLTLSGDSAQTQTFVWNYANRAWTKWTFGFSSAIVEPTTDRLYFSKPSDLSVYRERKSFSNADYSDPEFPITITAITGSTVSFTFSGTTPVAGMVVSQGGTGIVISSVTTISGVNCTCVLLYSAPTSWANGAASLFPSVGLDVQWNFWTGGNAGLLKHVRQVELLTDSIAGNNNTTSLVATFQTDFDGTPESQAITSAAYKWDSAPWGQFAWGGVPDTYAYPTTTPSNKQYCRLMSLGVQLLNANEKISISGYSMTYDVVSERVGQ